MTAWPASLPQAPMVEGFSETTVDNVLRSDMSYGPDKIRRRSTVVIKRVNMQMILSNTQMLALDTFYYTTIQQVGPVDWTDHRLQVAATYRFTAPPTFIPIGYDDDANEQIWMAILQMEIVP